MLGWVVLCFVVFFFKQNTADEMRISDWSSDVCSSDLDADVDQLLDPDPRPLSAAAQFWPVPIAGWAMKRRGNVIDRTVGGAAQDEVRAKLSRFVRARWFEPPFGGETFTGLIFDAFDAMESGPRGPAQIGRAPG